MNKLFDRMLQEAPANHCIGACYFCSPFVVSGSCEHYYLALHLFKHQDFSIAVPQKKRKHRAAPLRANGQQEVAEGDARAGGGAEPEGFGDRADVSDAESEAAVAAGSGGPVEEEADPDLVWEGQGKAAADACVEREMSRSIRMWEFFGYKKMQRAQRQTRL